MRIAALDFETANNHVGSICAVGVATYVDGVQRETFSSLVKPHASHYRSGWFFEHIHGIKRSDVTNSPEFPEVLEQFSSLLTQSDLVVCHNAAFDIRQLQAALDLYQEQPPDFHYACTYRISRKILPHLPNHKLNTVAGHFRFPFRHHDALDDARAAGYIMVRLMNGGELEDMVKRYGVQIRRFSDL